MFKINRQIGNIFCFNIKKCNFHQSSIVLIRRKKKSIISNNIMKPKYAPQLPNDYGFRTIAEKMKLIMNDKELMKDDNETEEEMNQRIQEHGFNKEELEAKKFIDDLMDIDDEKYDENEHLHDSSKEKISKEIKTDINKKSYKSNDDSNDLIESINEDFENDEKYNNDIKQKNAFEFLSFDHITKTKDIKESLNTENKNKNDIPLEQKRKKKPIDSNKIINRQEKFGFKAIDVLQEFINNDWDHLQIEASWPEIVKVDVSPDLRRIVAYWSITNEYGDMEERKTNVSSFFEERLNNIKKVARVYFTKRVQTKYAPEIVFFHFSEMKQKKKQRSYKKKDSV